MAIKPWHFKFWQAGSAGIKPSLLSYFLARGLIVFCIVCFFGCHTIKPVGLDLDDKPIDPLETRADAVVVLIFVSNDCPISNRYAPEIQRLANRFGPRGVQFWLVHPDPDESPSAIREHARQYELNLPMLRDPLHQLVRLARAKVTPSAAVFADRRLLYHGRIDDRLTDFGKERQEATRHDLAEAIEAVLTYCPISSPETKAIGCYIPSPRS